jgi:tryptophan-rich sensory protein
LTGSFPCFLPLLLLISIIGFINVRWTVERASAILHLPYPAWAAYAARHNTQPYWLNPAG